MITLVFWSNITTCFQSRLRQVSSRPHSAICLSENVQSLFRCDAREEPDGEAFGVAGFLLFVTVQVDSQRYNANLILWNPEVVGHEARVVFTDRNESIDILDILPYQLFGLTAVGLLQSFQEKILALESAADWAVQGFFNRFRQSEQ